MPNLRIKTFSDSIWSCQMIDEFDLHLSSRGLRIVPMNLHEGDFEFIVDDKSYKCNTILAEFISPKVCSLRLTDPSFSKLRLSVNDPSSQFDKFLSLPFESHLKVDSENFDFYVSVSKELENQELLSQLASFYFEKTEMTKSNAVKRLRLMETFGENGQEEISFIARNFSEIEGLADLKLHHLRQILAHHALRIPSEDFLYDFICQMISEDPSYCELLEFVMFKFLSTTSIQHFVKLDPSFIFDHFNISLWNSLCDRLCEKLMINTASLETQKSRFGDVIVQDGMHKWTDKIISLTEELEKVRAEKEKQNEWYRQNTPCTFIRTGLTEAKQAFYHCRTCGLVGDLVCCEACRNSCHAGHDVKYVGVDKGYCDCGEGCGKTRCLCMPPGS